MYSLKNPISIDNTYLGVYTIYYIRIRHYSFVRQHILLDKLLLL